MVDSKSLRDTGLNEAFKQIHVKHTLNLLLLLFLAVVATSTYWVIDGGETNSLVVPYLLIAAVLVTVSAVVYLHNRATKSLSQKSSKTITDYMSHEFDSERIWHVLSVDEKTVSCRKFGDNSFVVYDVKKDVFTYECYSHGMLGPVPTYDKIKQIIVSNQSQSSAPKKF